MTTETTYAEIDSWPLANGDKVIIVRATVRQPGGIGSPRLRRYHWTVVAPNGAKVGTSGESFTRRRTAVRAAERHYPRVVAE